MSAAMLHGLRMRLLRRACNGTAAVEFALILPLLTVLLFGTVDLGRLLADHQAAAQGIRDGTRYLARADPSVLGIDCALGTIDEASAPALAAMNLAMTGTIDGSAGYVLRYWNDSSSLAAARISITVTCVANGGALYRGLYDGTAAVASVHMQADLNFPLLNGWLLGRDTPLPLRVHHRQIHVGGHWGI